MNANSLFSSSGDGDETKSLNLLEVSYEDEEVKVDDSDVHSIGDWINDSYQETT